MVYSGKIEVEGIEGGLVKDIKELSRLWEQKQIGIMVDPEWKTIGDLRPDVVIDATMAKRNLGTRKDETPLVIGVGPGFTAPLDVHVVVESNRGHDLGRAIYHGAAEPHTGIPSLTAASRGNASYVHPMRA